jgi:hypothetical protein
LLFLIRAYPANPPPGNSKYGSEIYKNKSPSVPEAGNTSPYGILALTANKAVTA